MTRSDTRLWIIDNHYLHALCNHTVTDAVDLVDLIFSYSSLQNSVLSLGADWLIAAWAYPCFCQMKWLGVFLLPLDGMLVHHRSLPCNLIGFPNNLSVPIILYSWMERGTVRVKGLAQEHNTISPARAQTPTARYRDECSTNHGVATPSISSFQTHN